MFQRCIDEGVWPHEKRVRSGAHGRGEEAGAAPTEAIDEGIARAQQREVTDERR